MMHGRKNIKSTEWILRSAVRSTDCSVLPFLSHNILGQPNVQTLNITKVQSLILCS